MPTIFDLLTEYDYLRGETAVLLMLLAAAVIVIVWDWRLALFSFVALYLFAIFPFLEFLDPRLAIVKPLTGFFVCLILYMTARQVRWGTVPTDLTAAEVQQWREQQRQGQLNKLPVASRLLVRVGLVSLLLLATWQAGGLLAEWLPLPSDNLSFVTTAVLGLALLGLLEIMLTSEPLKSGFGLLLLLLAFELFHSTLDQTPLTLGLLSATNLLLAVGISHLVHVHHAPALATQS